MLKLKVNLTSGVSLWPKTSYGSGNFMFLSSLNLSTLYFCADLEKTIIFVMSMKMTIKMGTLDPVKLWVAEYTIYSMKKINLIKDFLHRLSSSWAQLNCLWVIAVSRSSHSNSTDHLVRCFLLTLLFFPLKVEKNKSLESQGMVMALPTPAKIREGLRGIYQIPGSGGI